MELIKITTIFATLFLMNLVYRQAEAKIFTLCELAKELMKHDIKGNLLSNWVCLVEHESGRSTSKVMQQSSLSVNYGLFQINSKNWCHKGFKGGLCNMKCEDLLNDDINDDVRCAKEIYNRNSFQAWNGWVNNCRAKNLPDVSKC